MYHQATCLLLLYALLVSIMTSPSSAVHPAFTTSVPGDSFSYLSNYEKLSKELTATPEDGHLRIACANALISHLRTKTNANALILNAKGGVDTSDTPENVELWKRYSDEALAIIMPLLKSEHKNSPEVAALYAEALTYKESTRGIVTSAMSGGAVNFLSAVDTLYKNHKLYDGAVSCIYKGAFNLAVPWPIGSTKKGARFFDEAYKAYPDSKRNRYYAALGAWATGNRDRTVELMKASLAAPKAPEGCSELDVETFFEKSAAEALHILGESTCE